MADQTKVDELLRKYTPEQLARAYLKASRERNEAVKLAEKMRSRKVLEEKMRDWAQAAGVSI